MTSDDTAGTMSDAPLICIIILNWNGWSDTLECLKSLEGLIYPNYRVLVLDNDSSNDSVARIKTAFPRIEVIQNWQNLGFAGGNNVGIRRAVAEGAEFVWLLNNDTIVDPHALSALVREAGQDERVGVVGSVLMEYSEPEVVQAWGGGKLWARWGMTTQAKQELHPVGHIIGASMLLRAETLRDIGLLDTSFFHFLEDTELSYRAVKKGWHLAVARGSLVYHKGGSSLKSSDEHRHLKADLYYVSSTAVFMGKYSSAPFAALRLLTMVAVRARRRELGRVPQLVASFARGFTRGRDTRGQHDVL